MGNILGVRMHDEELGKCFALCDVRAPVYGDGFWRNGFLIHDLFGPKRADLLCKLAYHPSILDLDKVKYHL
ncbi:hypothetical protein D3C81_1868360 [compost metagenome]